LEGAARGVVGELIGALGPARAEVKVTKRHRGERRNS